MICCSEICDLKYQFVTNPLPCYLRVRYNKKIIETNHFYFSTTHTLYSFQRPILTIHFLTIQCGKASENRIDKIVINEKYIF